MLKGPNDERQVQRIVCGGCLDFKIIIKCKFEDFGAFEADGFGGEAEIIKELEATANISSIETQVSPEMC